MEKSVVVVNYTFRIFKSQGYFKMSAAVYVIENLKKEKCGSDVLLFRARVECFQGFIFFSKHIVMGFQF